MATSSVGAGDHSIPRLYSLRNFFDICAYETVEVAVEDAGFGAAGGMMDDVDGGEAANAETAGGEDGAAAPTSFETVTRLTSLLRPAGWVEEDAAAGDKKDKILSRK